MKKLGLFLIVSLFSVCLTSCLNSDSTFEDDAIGVMTYGSKGNSIVIKTWGGDILGGPSINALYMNGDMTTDGCYYFRYLFDRDLPENHLDVVAANGFTTVSILGYQEIDKYYMSYSLTDTSTVMPEEVPIVDGCYNIRAYINKNLFLTHTANQPTDLSLYWDMSYDANTMMPTIVDAERLYDIYIRARKTNSSSNSKVNLSYINAYYVSNYLENAAIREKELNPSATELIMRFNYVASIDENDKITWGSTIQRVSIAAILASMESE